MFSAFVIHSRVPVRTFYIDFMMIFEGTHSVSYLKNRKLDRLKYRRALKIPEEIEGKERGFIYAQQRYSEKAEKLRGIGYTSEQVAKFLKDEIEEPNEEKHKAELAVLRKELAALNAFTRDYPNYDQRLLIGTPFENWKPDNADDFDKSAMALAQ